MKNLITLFVLLCIAAFGLKAKSSDKEVYQKGYDKNALWGYVGMVPRVKSADDVKVIISKEGFTLRVHALIYKDQIESYAKNLIEKFRKFEKARLGLVNMSWVDGTYTIPFKVLDEHIYSDYKDLINQKVLRYETAGYYENLELLKSFFPESVYVKKDGNVILDLVYPITTGAGALRNFSWLKAAPAPRIYTTHYFEERRTIYTKKKNSYIFAGFPAFWFHGGIGIHGPIRYTRKRGLLDGLWSNIDPGRKRVFKRWQLVRKPDSHNCIRMENHFELRHLLPAQSSTSHKQEELSKVKIIVTNQYDRYDVDKDGDLETIGVKYYWEHPDKQPNEKNWKRKYYRKGVPRNLYEYSYRRPQIIQLSPLRGTKINGRSAGLNSNATSAYLNRL